MTVRDGRRQWKRCDLAKAAVQSAEALVAFVALAGHAWRRMAADVASAVQPAPALR